LNDYLIDIWNQKNWTHGSHPFSDLGLSKSEKKKREQSFTFSFSLHGEISLLGDHLARAFWGGTNRAIACRANSLQYKQTFPTGDKNLMVIIIVLSFPTFLLSFCLLPIWVC
jgi:hypothetical protein